MNKFLAAFAICLLCCSNSHAKLRVIGTGEAMRLDPASIAPEMKSSFEIFSVRCVKCHSMQRTILALESGLGPITLTIFDRNAIKAYGVKMLRKPGSGMTKQEVKSTVQFLNYLFDQSNGK